MWRRIHPDMSGRARIGQEMIVQLYGHERIRTRRADQEKVGPGGHGDEKDERYRSPKAIAETTQKR